MLYWLVYNIVMLCQEYQHRNTFRIYIIPQYRKITCISTNHFLNFKKIKYLLTIIILYEEEDTHYF